MNYGLSTSPLIQRVAEQLNRSSAEDTIEERAETIVETVAQAIQPPNSVSIRVGQSDYITIDLTGFSTLLIPPSAWEEHILRFVASYRPNRDDYRS